MLSHGVVSGPEVNLISVFHSERNKFTYLYKKKLNSKYISYQTADSYTIIFFYVLRNNKNTCYKFLIKNYSV